MAEQQQDRARQGTAGDVTPTDERTSETARARAAQSAREQSAALTETVPGGKYKVGDVYVDANGFPLTDGAGRSPVGGADSAPSVKDKG